MKAPTKFIVIQERAAGNSSIGTEWLETASFPPETTLAEVWEWARLLDAETGRTMIRPDRGTTP